MICSDWSLEESRLVCLWYDREDWLAEPRSGCKDERQSFIQFLKILLYFKLLLSLQSFCTSPDIRTHSTQWTITSTIDKNVFISVSEIPFLIIIFLFPFHVLSLTSSHYFYFEKEAYISLSFIHCTHDLNDE